MLVEAQAEAGELPLAIEMFHQITDESFRSAAQAAVAIAQANAGLGEQAVKTTEAMLADRDEHLDKIAAALAKGGDREPFKQLLIPCGYYLDVALNVCALLADLYPTQAEAIARVVQESGPDPSAQAASTPV